MSDADAGTAMRARLEVEGRVQGGCRGSQTEAADGSMSHRRRGSLIWSRQFLVMCKNGKRQRRGRWVACLEPLPGELRVTACFKRRPKRA
jgi:hypothetical protein